MIGNDWAQNGSCTEGKKACPKVGVLTCAPQTGSFTWEHARHANPWPCARFSEAEPERAQQPVWQVLLGILLLAQRRQPPPGSSIS